MINYVSIPPRPKFASEGRKLGEALDHWSASRSPEHRDRFMRWYRPASKEEKAAWFKFFRTQNLGTMYGDPGRESRTKQYRQKFGPGLPKRPKVAVPTTPFGLNTPTECRSDSWFFGASMAGDWLEAACRFGHGAMPLKIALALQHEAMFRGSPVDIELKSGRGSGNLRIREQFGIPGSGYNKGTEKLRSAGLVYYPKTGGRKRNRYTILGPYIGFDGNGWVHYLDGVPVKKVEEVEGIDDAKQPEDQVECETNEEGLVPVSIRKVFRVGDQELTTHPLDNPWAMQILLDGEPYLPPYHKFLTTKGKECLTKDEIDAIGRKLSSHPRQ